MVNKKLLLILFSLITFTSYSQENDDVYWTMYDADHIGLTIILIGILTIILFI